MQAFVEKPESLFLSKCQLLNFKIFSVSSVCNKLYVHLQYLKNKIPVSKSFSRSNLKLLEDTCSQRPHSNLTISWGFKSFPT